MGEDWLYIILWLGIWDKVKEQWNQVCNIIEQFRKKIIFLHAQIGECIEEKNVFGLQRREKATNWVL